MNLVLHLGALATELELQLDLETGTVGDARRWWQFRPPDAAVSDLGQAGGCRRSSGLALVDLASPVRRPWSPWRVRRMWIATTCAPG